MLRPALRLTALTLLVASGAAAQGRSAAEEVLAVQQRRFAAATSRDVQALDQIVAADLEYCHSQGTVDTKASYLDAVRTGRIRWVEIRPSGMRARVYRRHGGRHRPRRPEGRDHGSRQRDGRQDDRGLREAGRPVAADGLSGVAHSRPRPVPGRRSPVARVWLRNIQSGVCYPPMSDRLARNR